MMSWFHASTPAADARNHASAGEIVACFRDHRDLLHRLAFFITADRAKAEKAVAEAREMTLEGNSPFRNWLLEWAKAATIAAAISLGADAIRSCEAMYKDRRCPHVAHPGQLDDNRRAASLVLLFQMDAQKIISELDPLCRAVLLLRIAIRSSIQDCSLRLNVSRAAILAANCLAMTWLDYRQLKPPEDGSVSRALEEDLDRNQP
jgi:DNA-directed RNA polymerase specialized sigma24 family protein